MRLRCISSRALRVPALVAVWSWIALSSHAASFTEDFSGNPTTNGWQIFGDTNLFSWDSNNRNLQVTWDSSQTNSYFHRPLGTVLTRDDDFSLSFDLTFEDYASGVTLDKPFAAPATIGFFNYDQAASTNFFRGAGINATYGPKNLVEFNFFPSFGGFLPTIDQVMVSTNNTWLYNQDNLLEMEPGETFRVTLDYLATTHTLTTVISNNGIQYGQTQTIMVPGHFDFRLTSVSISSYSDERDVGSILAHGWVDNLSLTMPEPPIQNLSGGFVGANWRVQFLSRTHWDYTLERATHFSDWLAVTTNTPGNGAILGLTDGNSPNTNGFYRVRADRP